MTDQPAQEATSCSCGSDRPESARYGHPHLPWCGAAPREAASADRLDAAVRMLEALHAAGVCLHWPDGRHLIRDEFVAMIVSALQCVVDEPREATLTGPKPRCVVCWTVYPTTGQHVGADFLLSGPGFQVCRRCVQAGRWAKTGGREQYEARAAFVAQVRRWWNQWWNGKEGRAMRVTITRMMEEPALAVYANKYGWPALLNALAEALGEEEEK